MMPLPDAACTVVATIIAIFGAIIAVGAVLGFAGGLFRTQLVRVLGLVLGVTVWLASGSAAYLICNIVFR